MFRGCKTEDMPPHVYSLAQTAYRSLVETRRDQSLIFMGRSGSGKTTSFKHALNYLALAAGMSLHTPCCCSSPPSSSSLSSSCCSHCALWADLVLSLPHQKLQFDVRLAHLHLAHTICHGISHCFSRNSITIVLFMTYMVHICTV